MKRLMIGMIVSVFLLNTGCVKKPDPVVEVLNDQQLTISFKNVVGTQPLTLKTTNYINAHGDTFLVNTYVYYISNISLYTEDGTEYKEPESYHLINETVDSSKYFTFKNIPSGDYTKIKFLIGVDSLRNVSGAQTGALDPMNGMFWDWNSGYIMAKIEGFSPQAGIYPGNVGFHLGGYKGINSVLRWVTLTLPSKAIVTAGKKPQIHILSDVAAWFKTPYQIDFSKTSFITSEGPTASKIAENYANMFSIDHID